MSDAAPAASDRAFKTLSRALIERVGGLDAAAACTRVRRAQLGNYQSMSCDAFPPVDIVARLEGVAGEPLLTNELARRAGYALVPVEPVREGELAMLLAHVGAESGAVFTAYAEALSNDGRVCAEERALIARELNDLVRAAHAALGHLRASPAEVGGAKPAVG